MRDHIIRPSSRGQPEGPTRGTPGETYTSLAAANDPDGDDIRYTFDWGDGNVTRTSYVSSGAEVSAN